MLILRNIEFKDFLRMVFNMSLSFSVQFENKSTVTCTANKKETPGLLMNYVTTYECTFSDGNEEEELIFNTSTGNVLKGSDLLRGFILAGKESKKNPTHLLADAVHIRTGKHGNPTIVDFQ